MKNSGRLPRRARLLVGLTGVMGSGKSSVARMLRARGAAVIDADAIAGSLLHPRCVVWRRLKRAFPGAFRKTRRLDRRLLAQEAFSSAANLRRLNRIMHPPLLRRIRQDIRRCRGRVVVVDAPLLLETGLGRLMDVVVVVATPQRLILKRLCACGRFGRSDIVRRMHAQFPSRAKRARADFIIENAGTRHQTEKQVERLWQRLSGVLQGEALCVSARRSRASVRGAGTV